MVPLPLIEDVAETVGLALRVVEAVTLVKPHTIAVTLQIALLPL